MTNQKNQTKPTQNQIKTKTPGKHIQKTHTQTKTTTHTNKKQKGWKKMTLGEKIQIHKARKYKITIKTPNKQITKTLTLTPYQFSSILKQILKKIQQKYNVRFKHVQVFNDYMGYPLHGVYSLSLDDFSFSVEFTSWEL